MILTALSGCKTLVLDEAFVFQPGRFGDPNATRTGQMRYEQIFQAPTDMTINVWADGQTAQHVIRSNEFVKSSVRHDVLKAGAEHIAISLIEREGPSRPLVVHCGGNASDRYESGVLYAQKIISVADVLMFDYPGYGDSSGRASDVSLREANKTIARYVERELGDRRPLILWGHSLGGFVCADMMQYYSLVGGIVLETTATNASDVSKAVIPWYARLFIRPRVAESLGAYDLVETLKTADVPILVLGAAKDKTLPVELSRKLANGLIAEGAAVTYTEFSRANHISIATQEEYPATIEAFISKLFAD
jgi:pimeloyl-ACP methyl ester carboxylesterase